MSISSEISRIAGNVADSLDAVAAKGVTVPAGSTSDDLPGLIAQITGGGGMTVIETQDSHGGTIVTITGEEVTLQSKTATPSTSSQTISPDSGYTGLSQVTVNAIPSQYIVPTGNKAITANGTGIDVAQYATVSVAVPAPNLQSKSATPSETAQTIEADSGYDGLSSVSVGAISSTYVGSGITRRSSTDLTASGATVTVPAGYYTSQATKAVSSGSATAPASISGTSASVSTGTNTLTLSKTVSVTPSVSAGYVSSGTAGNSSVSLTASVTTKAAATITPTKSTQTIASGTYLTGTQTIAAIPAAYQDVTGVTAAAGDVVSGKSIVDSTGATVNGSLVIQHYYTGSGTPSSSLGSNGDIYLKTS